jgi:hypothetical protein
MYVRLALERTIPVELRALQQHALAIGFLEFANAPFAIAPSQ